MVQLKAQLWLGCSIQYYTFQFLMVQLKAAHTEGKAVDIMISIPNGSIKRCNRQTYSRSYRISIPNGSIKRSGVEPILHTAGTFQFLMVQLKVGS